MWSSGSINVLAIPALKKKVCNFVGGVRIPPCGVPSVVSVNIRFSITPERKKFQIK